MGGGYTLNENFEGSLNTIGINIETLHDQF